MLLPRINLLARNPLIPCRLLSSRSDRTADRLLPGSLATHSVPRTTATRSGHGLEHSGRPRVRPVDEPRLGLPAGVGLGGEDLDALLAVDLVALLLEGGRRVAEVAEPLVPLGRRDDLAVMGAAGVLYYPAPAACVVVASGEAEFPVGVAAEIEA